MDLLQIKKHKDRCRIPLFLAYVRTQDCEDCKALGVKQSTGTTASHMISVKWAAGSDALAIPQCMLHHLQSTKSTKESAEKNEVDIPKVHQKLWNGFLQENANCFYQIITQEDFERVCGELGFVELPYSRRKNR